MRKLREVIRKIIEEEVQIQLIHGQPNSTVIYSTDRTEDPMGLVPLQSSKPKNHLRVKTYADTFLEMAEDGGSVTPDIRFNVKQGRPVAPPFLIMTYIESVNAWQVDQHEGRSRTKTIKEMTDKVSLQIPMDIFLRRKESSEGYSSTKVAYSSLSNKAQEALKGRVVPQYNSPIESEDKSYIDLLVNRMYHKIP